MTNVIRIAAAVILDDDGRLLLVRKRGTTVWMQPGGKLEAGETPAVTLARELFEELGLVVDPTSFDHWGRFDAPAANEEGFVVDADIFGVTGTLNPVVAAEIEELVWVSADNPEGLPIAPLSDIHVLPVLLRDGR